jgi:hypothetical protein
MMINEIRTGNDMTSHLLEESPMEKIEKIYMAAFLFLATMIYLGVLQLILAG